MTTEYVTVNSSNVADADIKSFQDDLERHYKKGAARIVLDLTAVNFMDSYGLGVIVYFHTRMEKEGRELVILNMNKEKGAYLNKLFEVTNLDKVLNIETEKI